MAIDVERVPGPGGFAFTHDLALDGDEDLRVGGPAELTDGFVTASAVVVARDDEKGYWFFTVR